MGTPSVTEFMQGDETVATIYRHWDGYPEEAGTDIYRFFAAVQEATSDTRFDDPSYLAAKYVVFLADMFGSGLDFLSVGIIPNGSNYGQEYVYRVNCDEYGKEPVVQGFRAGESESLEIPRP